MTASPFTQGSAVDVRLSPPPAVPIRRLSVEQYHEMVRAGIFTEDDRVELSEGVLVTKMVINPRHRGTTRAVRKVLEAVVPGGWFVDSQAPITLPTSESEPDVLVARGDRLPQTAQCEKEAKIVAPPSEAF